MISHRLRALVAGIPTIVFATVLVASPGFAAESLSISTPLASSTVSGDLVVEGTIAGDAAVDLSLALAAQTLGDCGAPLIESRLDGASSSFSVSIPTEGLADGTYCLIAVADAGRLSTVIGDITVSNVPVAGETLDGFQLPTEALGAADDVTPSATAGITAFATSSLGVLVLSSAAVLAMVVLVLAQWVRRRAAS